MCVRYLINSPDRLHIYANSNLVWNSAIRWIALKISDIFCFFRNTPTELMHKQMERERERDEMFKCILLHNVDLPVMEISKRVLKHNNKKHYV